MWKVVVVVADSGGNRGSKVNGFGVFILFSFLFTNAETAVKMSQSLIGFRRFQPYLLSWGKIRLL